jgi:large subunit ribosomal protein L3
VQTPQPIEVVAVEVLEKQMSLSNSLGLLGRKVGMMRLFTDDGDAVPVTVVDVSNNRVTQIKTQENDGYVALQVTFGSRKASRVTKPEAGHLAKAGVEAGEIIQEFRVTADTAAKYAAGASVPVTDPCFPWVKRSTCKALPSVRATPAPSSATTWLAARVAR